MQAQALLVIGLIGLLGVGTLIALWLLSQGLSLWLQAAWSGERVPYGRILQMRFLKIDAQAVALSRIRAMRAGLDIPVDDLMTHQLAGGSAPRVVGAMARAHQAGALIEWTTACATDLAGHDPQVAADILIAADESGVELDRDDLWQVITDDAGQEAFLARVRVAARPG